MGAPEQAGWHAQLQLGFARAGARTVLCERAHHGPLRVQRAFYPEADGSCQVILLHPPGGLVGGDQLQIELTLGGGAHALITTPGACKLYRSAGAMAKQTQRLQVAAGGCIEWLPQEVIAFAGTHTELLTRAELTGDARFLGWEIVCLGRPASGERFTHGTLRQRLELWRDQQPLFLERAVYVGGNVALQAAWGLAGEPVVGTFLCTAPGLQALELAPLAREALKSPLTVTAGELVSASCIGDVLVARYLGPSTERARACFTNLWVALRPQLLGLTAVVPRIWRT